jgi:signal peptidase II
MPLLNLTLVYNRGAAFGFLNDAAGWQNLFFIVVAVVAVGVMGYLLHRSAFGALAAVGLALVLGGAVGNLIDRLIHGHVIDFIDAYYRSAHWPAFNAADSAITIGAALLVWDALGFARPKRRLQR